MLYLGLLYFILSQVRHASAVGRPLSLTLSSCDVASRAVVISCSVTTVPYKANRAELPVNSRLLVVIDSLVDCFLQ